MQTQASNNLSRYILIVVILTIGAALRTTGLAHESFWTDELFSVGTATALPNPQGFWHFERKIISELTLYDSFWTWKGADQSPPLFELILAAWNLLAGNSELAMRLPSAAASTLALVIVSFALWRILPARMLISYLLLLTLSWPAIAYAKEARVYALATLFSTIAAVSFIRAVVALRRGAAFRLSWSLAFTLAGLSLSHNYGWALAGILTCIIMSYVWMFGHKNDLYRLSILPICLLPWFYINAHALRFAAEGHLGWRSYSFSELFSLVLPETFKFFFPGDAAIVVIIALIVGLPMTVRHWRKPVFTTPQEQNTHRALLEITWGVSALLLALIVVALIIARGSGSFHPRHLLILSPWLSFIIAYFLQSIWKTRIIPAVLLNALIAYFLIHSIFDQNRKTTPNEQYREAAAFIASKIHSDAVVVGTWPANLLYYSVYLRRFIPSSMPYRLESMKGAEDAERISQRLCAGDAKPKQVFLFAHVSHMPWAKALLERCGAAFPSHQERSFLNLNVVILGTE